MAENTYVLVGDEETKVKGKKIACEKDVDYPSTFFTATRSKPSIKIYYKNETLDQLRTSLYVTILSNNPDVHQAVSYLYKLYLPRKELNTSRWESYGVTIAVENVQVDPFCTLQVTEDEHKPVDLQTTTNANSSFDTWMPFVLVVIFRASRVIHESYRTVLIENVKRQAVGLPEGISLEAICTASGSWTSNVDYCKICAALDMFYYRFPKSIHSNIRIGTISARYRECAALTNYQHLTKVVGAPTMGSLFEWVFNHTVKNDILRIFKSEEELDREFSYFPYQVDFGLVQKSAYSATTNSGLYVWGSIICVLNKDPQGLNARLLD